MRTQAAAALLLVACAARARLSTDFSLSFTGAMAGGVAGAIASDGRTPPTLIGIAAGAFAAFVIADEIQRRSARTTREHGAPTDVRWTASGSEVVPSRRGNALTPAPAPTKRLPDLAPTSWTVVVPTASATVARSDVQRTRLAGADDPEHACAKAKRDTFDALRDACRATRAGVSATDIAATECRCDFDPDTGAVECTTHGDATCTDDPAATIAVGSAAAGSRTVADAQATEAARRSCAPRPTAATPATCSCNDDSGACVCVVVATCTQPEP